MSKAHVLDAAERTQDVQINEEISFEGLILAENTLKGLTTAGFKRPSPIQLVAIPLGKCGFDLIAEAKSGTGKTVMFGVIALEMLELPSKSLQVLILAPTREIAAQVGDVLASIGQGYKGLKVGVFIGGLPVEEDRRRAKNCHIAVGTPGRLKHLIQDKMLGMDHVRLVVIDEADKLLEPSFEPDISSIFKSLPVNKQVVAASATYSPELKSFLEDYMRSPIRVNPEQSDIDNSKAVLIGVRQVAVLVPYHPNAITKFKNKLEALVSILSCVPFKQCIVFNNSHGVSQTISETLKSKGWPTEFISSSMDQPKRLAVINKFFEYKCRVLLSTDLVARGIDVANVDLVVNLDVPMTCATYLHRVGRSGRFGTRGLAIAIVENDSKDLTRLAGFINEINIPMYCFKVTPTSPLNEDLSSCPLPNLLDEVAEFLKPQPRPEVFEDTIPEEEEPDSVSSKSSSSDLEELDSSSEEVEEDKDLPAHIRDAIKSDSVKPQPLPKQSNMEDDLSKELVEMHLATKANGSPSPSPAQNGHSHSPAHPRQYERTPEKSPIWRQQHSPHSPNRRLNFFHYPPGSPRRDFSPRQGSGYSSQDYSSDTSSQQSTPKKDSTSDLFRPFSADKYIYSFAKYSDEPRSATSYAHQPSPANWKPPNPAQQQYYQHLYENNLRELLEEIRSHRPPRLDPVLGYDGLEASCKSFNPTAPQGPPAYERDPPRFSRKAVLMGMGRQLGTLCNIAKRHFAFNGGIKAFLNQLADGYEPDEADLPHWDPGHEGFKVHHDAWVHGNEYVEKKRQEIPSPIQHVGSAVERQHRLTPPTPMKPKALFVGDGGDGGTLNLAPPPAEHHTIKFPPFPTQPGASLAEWREQVKLSTFMVHYSEYFRMMNKK